MNEGRPMFGAAARQYDPSEIYRYARRSAAGEGASKSIEDQDLDMLDMLGDHGLPEGQLFAEKPGHSGSLWYKCEGKYGVSPERMVDENGRPKHRPVLSQVVRAIQAGQVKVLVCWAQDRLWRSVSICDFLCDMLVEHGVELYDRYGRVDIVTPEGRAQVRNNANAAQAYRETAKHLTRRGLRRNRLKSKISSNPNCLGMRSAGKGSNRVVFVEEELRLLRTIFELFTGEDPRGPLRPEALASLLDEEGYRWPTDLLAPSEEFDSAHGDRILGWRIRDVLVNPRYQGMERSKRHGDYPCPAFLKDGEPVIPRDLWARAKSKIAADSRVGCRGRGGRPLASKVVCGFCGQPLEPGVSRKYLADGTRRENWFYIARHGETSICTHTVPTVMIGIVEDYVVDVLGPIVAAHLDAARSTEGSDAVLDAHKKREEIQDLVRQRDVELMDLASSSWRSHPELVARMADQLDERIRSARAELAVLEDARTRLAPTQNALEALSSANGELRRDAIRAMVRWMAFVPAGLPHEVNKKGARVRNRHQGWVLVLTALGTYHTALIEYGPRPKGDFRGRTNVLVPAEPHESLTGIGDLPAPECFVRNLRRAWRKAVVPFDMESDAPGYREWLATHASTAVNAASGDPDDQEP